MFRLTNPLKGPACWLVVAAISALGTSVAQAAEAVPDYSFVPGFERIYSDAGSDAARGGLILLGELNCAACHKAEGTAAAWVTTKQAPLLGEVGSRVTPDYLRKFIADPHGVKPGTTMPSLLANRTPAQRSAIVEPLVHYLVSLRSGKLELIGPSQGAVERGEPLFHKIGCVACHAPKRDANAALAQKSVPLGKLETKYSIGGLTKFLLDPLQVRPTGRMPKMNLSLGEARDLAHYLLKDNGIPNTDTVDQSYYEGKWSRMPDFNKSLAKKIGTVETFGLSNSSRKVNFALMQQGHITLKEDALYTFYLTSHNGSKIYLDGKLLIDNDGIHKSKMKWRRLKVKKGRHTFRAEYFQTSGPLVWKVELMGPGIDRGPISKEVLRATQQVSKPPAKKSFVVDATLAAKGKALFLQTGCASCHQLGGNHRSILGALSGPPLAKLQAGRGCLSAEPGKRRPHYRLSDKQTASLTAALSAISNKKLSTQKVDEQVVHTMASMNCYACHQRGKLGGVTDERNKFYTAAAKDLGDEGRVPPALNEVGAKLTADGFSDMLLKGNSYRTAMNTRMPLFGQKNIGHLPALFAKADAGKIPAYKQPTLAAKESKKAIKDGRILVDKKHLTCINCHAWGSKRLPGAEGLDLLQTKRRLQPAWFHAFLTNPQALKPRTRMPTSWPDGKSFFSKIQNGDMHKQIDALWAYLAAGERGGIPKGLAPKTQGGGMMVPTDEPITFRTFTNGISAHAILVGFPEKVNVAFDANRVRMVLVWSGNFVSTGPVWNGRAGGYVSYSGDIVKFPDGPSWFKLQSIEQPWPKDVPKVKMGSERTAKGHRFRGYRFDENRVPTFLYDVEEVRVEETARADEEEEKSLSRSFRLISKQDVKNLHLLLATGATIKLADGSYRVDDKVGYRIKSSSKPFIRESAGRKELLVPVQFGPSADGKSREAKINVHMSW